MRRALHCVLRQQARRAQRVKAGLRVPAAASQSRPRTRLKIRPERTGAVDEREHVHVLVRARVRPVDQARLGCDGRLAQQRALRLLAHARGIGVRKVRVDDRMRPVKQRRHRMRAASGADRRVLSAQQAFARRKAELRPRDLFAVRRDDVDVQQPAHGAAVLQRAQPALDLLRVALHGEHGLRTGLLVDGRVKEHRVGRQHRLNLRLAPCKRALDGGRGLHRARDIHRQADQRRAGIARKQRPLHDKARLPRLHHVRNRHVDLCHRRSPPHVSLPVPCLPVHCSRIPPGAQGGLFRCRG